MFLTVILRLGRLHPFVYHITIMIYASEEVNLHLSSKIKIPTINSGGSCTTHSKSFQQNIPASFHKCPPSEVDQVEDSDENSHRHVFPP